MMTLLMFPTMKIISYESKIISDDFETPSRENWV